MSSIMSTGALLLLIQLVAFACVAEYDYLYFIQQWPGSICATKEGCCFPTTGKPASDFIVHGLQPGNMLGTDLVNCDSKTRFDSSKLSNLTRSWLYRDWPSLVCPRKDASKLWASQWKKYGTCTEPVFNPEKYFRNAINLRKNVNLLQILKNAGFMPNGSFYKLSEMFDAILNVVWHMPGIQCNKDKYGNLQLNLIYLCGNEEGRISDCPGMAPSNCNGMMKFPAF